MIELCVDLSSKRGSVALGQNGQCIDELFLPVDFKHCEEIMPAIDTLLTRNSLALDKVQSLFCTIGPGSFTGLRIALSTLKALSLSLNLPIGTFHAAELQALSMAVDEGEIVEIVSQLAQSNFLITKFEIDGMGLRFLEDRYSPSQPEKGLKRTECSARLLAEFGSLARLKHVFQNTDEIIALTPLYFGASRFG